MKKKNAGGLALLVIKNIIQNNNKAEWPRFKNQKADQRNRKGNLKTNLNNCNKHFLHGKITVTNKNKQKVRKPNKPNKII